jgi:hypothetical protein
MNNTKDNHKYQCIRTDCMSKNRSRYTISITPSPTSSHWQKGCTWLGFDPIHHAILKQPAIVGIDSNRLWVLTGAGRRRGLQGFLKSPFRLADHCTEEDIIAKMEKFSADFKSFSVPGLQLVEREQRFCLEPTAYPLELINLAARCFAVFYDMSAPLNLYESARLRAQMLSPQEKDNVGHWGIPQGDGQYRMQIVLTSRVTEPNEKEVIFSALSNFFSNQNNVPLVIDGLSLFVEAGTKMASSHLLARFPLARQSKNAKEQKYNEQKSKQNVYS